MPRSTGLAGLSAPRDPSRRSPGTAGKRGERPVTAPGIVSYIYLRTLASIGVYRRSLSS
jgi:hypothetical protein